jgi:hypothetical protein
MGGTWLVEERAAPLDRLATRCETGTAKPSRDGGRALTSETAQGKVRAHWSAGQCEQLDWVGRSQEAGDGEACRCSPAAWATCPGETA